MKKFAEKMLLFVNNFVRLAVAYLSEFNEIYYVFQRDKKEILTKSLNLIECQYEYIYT